VLELALKVSVRASHGSPEIRHRSCRDASVAEPVLRLFGYEPERSCRIEEASYEGPGTKSHFSKMVDAKRISNQFCVCVCLLAFGGLPLTPKAFCVESSPFIWWLPRKPVRRPGARSSREDVMVYLGRTRAQVTDWIPLRGEHAASNSSLIRRCLPDVSLGSQLEDLRQFILLHLQPRSSWWVYA